MLLFKHDDISIDGGRIRYFVNDVGVVHGRDCMGRINRGRGIGRGMGEKSW
jgi:hypothetical protein